MAWSATHHGRRRVDNGDLTQPAIRFGAYIRGPVDLGVIVHARCFIGEETDMTRAEDDTWDLATSVGAAATSVAVGEDPLASRAPNALIDDPFAEPLVRAVGVGILHAARHGELNPAEVDGGAGFRDGSNDGHDRRTAPALSTTSSSMRHARASVRRSFWRRDSMRAPTGSDGHRIQRCTKSTSPR